jgi:hypothetical protein
MTAPDFASPGELTATQSTDTARMVSEPRDSRGERRANAAETSRGAAWLRRTFAIPANVGIVKLPHTPFGQVYDLEFLSQDGLLAKMLVVARTARHYKGMEWRVHFHLANRELLNLIRQKAERHVPVIFVAEALPEADASRTGERLFLAVPLSRIQPAIDQYLASGGGSRIPLSVSLTRQDKGFEAILTRENLPISLSDYFGLRELHKWFPATGARCEHDRTQFTAQFQWAALLGERALTTVDGADIRRSGCQSTADKLGVVLGPNVKTGNGSGLERSDVVALQDIKLTAAGFTEPGVAPCVMIGEVEASGGKAEVRRKLRERIDDAVTLGAPAESIYACAVVPEQQKAAVAADLHGLLAERERWGKPRIGGIAVWSTFEVRLAYGYRTGAWSPTGHELHRQILGPLR